MDTSKWNKRYVCQDCDGPLMVECDYTGHATLIVDFEAQDTGVLSGTDPDEENNDQESTWGRVYCRNCGQYQPFEADGSGLYATLEYSEAMAERIAAEHAEDDEDEND